MLKALNPHPNDSLIYFDEKPHLYYVDGKKIESSVTTFIHKQFPAFDANKIAESVYKKNFTNKKSPYFEMTVDDIKKSWEENRVKAATSGTKLHKSIEQYYNEEHDDIDEDLMKEVEWSYFQNFVNDHPELKAYRTEWEIFDTDLNLAGSIDMVFKKTDDDGKETFTIYDWKKSKEIRTKNDFESGFEPVEHLPNCNYWHYSLQLNVYKRILETKYGLNIDGMHLIVLHENNKNYKHYEVPLLEDEVDALFEARKRTFLQMKQPQSER